MLERAVGELESTGALVDGLSEPWQKIAGAAPMLSACLRWLRSSPWPWSLGAERDTPAQDANQGRSTDTPENENPQVRPRYPDWFREDLRTLLQLLREDKIHPVVAERLPFTDARRAHELLESSAAKGKLVLVP